MNNNSMMLTDQRLKIKGPLHATQITNKTTKDCQLLMESFDTSIKLKLTSQIESFKETSQRDGDHLYENSTNHCTKYKKLQSAIVSTTSNGKLLFFWC